MTDKKHTQGPVEVTDNTFSNRCHVEGKGINGEPFILANCKAYSTFVTAVDPETCQANALLIMDAFNVAHETGKTPRQLAESNAELVETLEKVLGFIDSGIDMAIGGFDLPPEPRTPYDREACEVCSWLTTLITKTKAGG